MTYLKAISGHTGASGIRRYLERSALRFPGRAPPSACPSRCPRPCRRRRCVRFSRGPPRSSRRRGDSPRAPSAMRPVRNPTESRPTGNPPRKRVRFGASVCHRVPVVLAAGDSVRTCIERGVLTAGGSGRRARPLDFPGLPCQSFDTAGKCRPRRNGHKLCDCIMEIRKCINNNWNRS